MFKKFFEVTPQVWIILLILLVLGIGFFFMVKSKKKNVWTNKMLAFASLCIALAFVLDMIRLYKMPQGGSITPGSMLPIILFSFVFGPIPGITAGTVYGLINFIQSGAPITNIWSFILDYVIGFGVLGLAGLFKSMKQQALVLAIIVACSARFIASVLSGVMFYYMYAPEGVSPLIYSLTYNGTYMLPEMVICVILSFVIGERVIKMMKGREITH